ncbi:unnamed protein product, partial [Polarella glacialis]
DFFTGTSYPMIYQARSALPTDFDCDLAYTLGRGAGILVNLGKSAQLVHASNLEQRDVNQWQVRGIPLTSLLKAEFDEETKEQCVLPGYHCLLKQPGVVRPFLSLPPPKSRSPRYLGPVQYWGDAVEAPELRTTWYMKTMPAQDPSDLLQDIAMLCGELQSTMALAKAESTLYAVNSLLSNAVSVLESYKRLGKKTGGMSLADVPMDHISEVWTTKHDDIRSPLRGRLEVDRSISEPHLVRSRSPRQE